MHYQDKIAKLKEGRKDIFMYIILRSEIMLLFNVVTQFCEKQKVDVILTCVSFLHK
jgi:hypothetical protein